MIELPVLFVLAEHELTMYSVLKRIHDKFGAFSKPSFGAVKPALTRLEKKGYIKSRRSISDGGKQSCFYAVTSDGCEYLKHLILEEISENPLQLVSNISLKIACASYLTKDERKNLFDYLKKITLSHKYEAENMLEQKNLDFYQRIIIDNTVIHYNNLVMLMENFEKDLEKF